MAVHVGAAPARPLPSALALEVGATVRLATPLAATQLAQIAITTIDVLMLGWLGAAPLAAAGLGLVLYHTLLLFGIGVLMATSTLFAQALGAGRRLEVRALLQQSWLVLLLIAAPCMLALATLARPFLALIGQEPALLGDTERFLDVLIWSMPGLLTLVMLRGFTSAFGTGRPALVVTLVGIPVNAVLCYGLIFGAFGLPRLELVGAALASSITHTLMAVAALAWCLVDRRFRRYAALRRFRFRRPLLTAILRLGLPVGGTLVMEAGLFSAAGLLIGLIGVNALAAHQVTIQIVSMLFMIPLGIGLAASVRIGTFTGAGDRAGARRAGYVACALGAACMIAFAVLFLVAAEPLTRLFLAEDDPASVEARSIAIGLLHVAALFQLVDGLQVIGNSALRGLGDTRAPMLIAALGYWVIGFPVAAGLGLATPLGGQGVWLGLALALAIVAIFFLRRFDRLTRTLPKHPAGRADGRSPRP